MLISTEGALDSLNLSLEYGAISNTMLVTSSSYTLLRENGLSLSIRHGPVGTRGERGLQ